MEYEVLGWPAQEAKDVLEARGERVRMVVYQARLPLEGANDRRVLRCRRIEDGTVELTVSEFVTVI